MNDQKSTKVIATINLSRGSNGGYALPSSVQDVFFVRHVPGDSGAVADAVGERVDGYMAHGVDHTIMDGNRGVSVRISPAVIAYISTELAPGEDIG